MTADEIDDLAHLAKRYRWSFVMLPDYWRNFQFSTVLQWRTTRFRLRARPALPDSPGVYAFLVKPAVAGRLDVSYLMYVGQTDSLRRRFGDYQREAQGNRSRAKLYHMFRMYPENLHFSFAELSLSDLIACENALMTAFWPPVNRNLPAAIRAARSAFES